MPLYMVFDVESVGLHGEGFAVGYVVVDSEGRTLEEGAYCVHSEDVRGSQSGREWVAANVSKQSCETLWSPADLRKRFWEAWQRWKEKGAALAADCAWPVEARFLAACVDDRPEVREWQGPYPLHEIATFRLAAGFDPLATADRLPSELPAHDPLADARQSARLLLEALAAVKS